MREMVFAKPAGEIINAMSGSDIKVTFVDINKNKASKRKWKKMVEKARKHGNTITFCSQEKV